MPQVKETTLIDCGPFKGIDTWTSNEYVAKENATDLLNVVPDRKLGSYNTARGRVVLNTPGTIGSTLGLKKFPRQGLSTLYIQAANTVVVSPTQMSLYQFPGSGGAVSQLTFPAGVTWVNDFPAYAVLYQKWMFWSNGNDRPLKVDFNLTVTRWQADAPTTAPVFVAPVGSAPSLAASVGTAPTLTPSASGGSLASATYFYVITALNSLGVETGKSPEASAVVTGPNGKVTVSWTASAGAASTSDGQVPSNSRRSEHERNASWWGFPGCWDVLLRDHRVGGQRGDGTKCRSIRSNLGYDGLCGDWVGRERQPNLLSHLPRNHNGRGERLLHLGHDEPA